MLLRSFCRRQEEVYSSLSELAEDFSLQGRTLQRGVQNLVDHGYIIRDGKDIILNPNPISIEDQPIEKTEAKLTKSQILRAELVQIWNRHKPLNAPTMRGYFTHGRLETLQVYAERFKCEEKVVLRKVLDGSNADEFRRDKAWDFDNIFGKGVPTEQKQGKVEKVYNLGCSTKGQNAVFDWTDDQCWLDWYQSKEHDMKSVTRIKNDDWEAAVTHEVEQRGDQVIYIYIDADGDPLHWTYKESHVGVSYLPAAS